MVTLSKLTLLPSEKGVTLKGNEFAPTGRTDILSWGWGSGGLNSFCSLLKRGLFPSKKGSTLKVKSLPPLGGYTFWGGLFVLRFYSPVNPMGSCRAQSVYLTTRLLGRLSPPSI